MPNYYVNKQAQPNGDHEVHKNTGCPHPANPKNRVPLGVHLSCTSAVKEAKKYFKQVNGCFFCARECHTS
ncbi:MAG: hypothetical protein ACJAT2_003616 [Bacteriovoracaceae bacterium]|jgi:hypothetical protein